MAVLWVIPYLDLPFLCLKINAGLTLLLLPASAPQFCVANSSLVLMTRLHPPHLRAVSLLLSDICRSWPLACCQGIHSVAFSLSFLPHGPCSVVLGLHCFWQPLHLFWALEIWAVSYFCRKWSLYFCFPFSLLLLDVLQQEKGAMLTAWATFRPLVPPLYFYTSISSTVKDPEIKVTRPLTGMANKMIIKFFMNDLLLVREWERVWTLLASFD